MARSPSCWGSILAALALAGCNTAPVLPPVRMMTALPATSTAELAGDVGYAAAPGAGLGSAVKPGTPFFEGEFRYAFAPWVQLTGGVGLTFVDYLLPWPTNLTVGTRLVAWDSPEVSIAIAPKITGASTFNLLSGAGETVFGTRDAELDVPVIVTHRFPNQMALSLQVWARGAFLRQEDSALTATSTTSPNESGQALAVGAAVLFSFPRLRSSKINYHVYLGGEELWLKQTAASDQDGPDPFNPLISLSRFSLTAGFGLTYPVGE